MKDLLTHVRRTTSRGVKKEWGAERRSAEGGGSSREETFPEPLISFPTRVIVWSSGWDMWPSPDGLPSFGSGAGDKVNRVNDGQMKKQEKETHVYSWHSLTSNQRSKRWLPAGNWRWGSFHCIKVPLRRAACEASECFQALFWAGTGRLRVVERSNCCHNRWKLHASPAVMWVFCPCSSVFVVCDVKVGVVVTFLSSWKPVRFDGGSDWHGGAPSLQAPTGWVWSPSASCSHPHTSQPHRCPRSFRLIPKHLGPPGDQSLSCRFLPIYYYW